MIDQIASQNASLDAQIIEHHLQLFGLRDSLPVILSGETADADHLAEALAGMSVVVMVCPPREFLVVLGLDGEHDIAAPAILEWRGPSQPSTSRRLRSLFPAVAYAVAPEGSVTIIADQAGRPVWLWLPRANGGVLVVGSDLAADLIRYRQGDPAAVRGKKADLWGVAGERPNYLFEEQRAGERRDCRHADCWAEALAMVLQHYAGLRRAPILPGGAPGAIVLTGDDDQAYLETYQQQQRILDRTPITYFLHHKTRYSKDDLRRLSRKEWIDFGLHPDALDTPEEYGLRLREQMEWYVDAVGRPPQSLRNHGFLNDGYWGHLPLWQREGIAFSTNLPGLDGHVMNGSLLPARVAADGVLTEHWSILTAFGDGMISALGITPQAAAEKIKIFSEDVQNSGLPGVIVINLHPQNIAQTRALHEAALAVISGGFLAWNMRQCLAWFRDGVIEDGRSDGAAHSRLESIWRRLRACLPA